MKKIISLLCLTFLCFSSSVAQTTSPVIFSDEFNSWLTVKDTDYSGYVGRYGFMGNDNNKYEFTLQKVKRNDPFLELWKNKGYIASMEENGTADSFKAFINGYTVTIDYTSTSTVTLTNMQDNVTGAKGTGKTVSIDVPAHGKFKFAAGSSNAQIQKITITAKQPETACDLATLAQGGKLNTAYTLSGNGLRAAHIVNDIAAGKYFLLVKDDNGQSSEKVSKNKGLLDYTIKAEIGTDAEKKPILNLIAQEDYDQSNWLLVEIPEAQATEYQKDLGREISYIKGILTDSINTTLNAATVAWSETSETFTPNVYCAVNFMARYASDFTGNAIEAKGEGLSLPRQYFFMSPKTNELARIVWAVWSKDDQRFYIPAQSGSINQHGFEGGFDIALDYNQRTDDAITSKTQLGDGCVYSFNAIIRKSNDSLPHDAPRKINANTNSYSSSYIIYPTDLVQNGSSIPTGVSESRTGKAITGVKYFDIMGHEAPEAFNGINVVVTTHDDGSTSTRKVMR